MNSGRLDMAQSTQPARLTNVRFAVARFGRIWTKSVQSSAAGQFARLWPVWAGGLLLVVLCAVVLDANSVEWARRVPSLVGGIFQWLTDFGRSGWLLIPGGVLCLVLLFSDWRVVPRRVAAAWTEIGLIAGFAFVSIAGSGVITNIIKQLVGRGRPIVFDSDGAFSLIPFQFDYAQASFPSGHSTTMGALAVIIAVIAPRVRWPAFLICGFIASSRVLVAAHYPSDVVAGFLLGAAFSWYFALSLSFAGTAFLRARDGTIRTRAVAIRRLLRQPGGFSVGMGCLWHAIFGVVAFCRPLNSK